MFINIIINNKCMFHINSKLVVSTTSKSFVINNIYFNKMSTLIVLNFDK